MEFKKMKVTTSALLAGLIVAGSTIPSSALNKTGKLTGTGKDVKNVIVMISDGWGYNQIMATDYYTEGRADTQIYENFPTQLSMSTYSTGSYDPATIWNDFNNLNIAPTDSAAAGTAMSTGEKTYDAAIGVDLEEADMTHISETFESLGRSTGVVSTVEFSHATPASFIAHDSNRNNYADIANDMIYQSSADVIIGCGNPDYDNDGNEASMTTKYVGGDATWADLSDGSVTGADANGDGVADDWSVIQSKSDFEALTTGKTPDRLIGIPEVYTTLQQARSGDGKGDAYEVALNDNLPDLATMSQVALNVLDNNDEGFFLMIEGGAIDWAGHANQSGRLIEEQEDFNTAVEAVCEWVEQNSSWSQTMLVVTGDHETGYLTGTAGVYDEVVNNGAGIMPTMAWNSGNHTNQLIPFFAKGAGAEIFKKLADQVDPVRGKYLDNTEIVTAINALIN